LEHINNNNNNNNNNVLVKERFDFRSKLSTEMASNNLFQKY